MKKILDHLKFIRFINCSLTVIIVLFSCFMAGCRNLSKILLASLIFFAGTAFANISNDIRDFRIDLIAHPERPLVSGRISLKEAYLLSVILLTMIFTPAYILGYKVLIFTSCLFFLTLAYNLVLKKFHIYGNIAVALISSATFFIGGVLTGNYGPLFFPFLLSYVFQLYREILKDIHDMDGDSLGGYRTLPLIIGRKLSIILSRFLLGLLVFLTLIPYWIGIYNRVYLYITLLFVDIPIILIGMRIRDGLDNRELKRYLDTIKIPIFFVLLAIYLGG